MICLAVVLTAPETQGADGVIFRSMEEELNRAYKVMKSSGGIPLYYLGYTVTDIKSGSAEAEYGSLKGIDRSHRRFLDVDLRVGDYILDNTHEIRDEWSWGGWQRPAEITVEEDSAALKTALWLKTDEKFKAAQQRYIKIKANVGVKVKEEDSSDDFSQETPVEFTGKPVSLEYDLDLWAEKIRKFSGLFKNYPEIYNSEISIEFTSLNRFLVTSEGTKIFSGKNYIRMDIYAGTVAEDGMRLYRYESFNVSSEERLPGEEKITAVIHKMAKDLSELRKAPVVEPYTGPAILAGRASGVFFHEIFGHRVEGHRQKGSEEGQTFKSRIGSPVLPEFISVYDDPTLEAFNGTELMGHYGFDDEGIPSERVVVVDQGILKNFLMSRFPIEKFPKSNGHGRRAPGYNPVARQGNLLIEALRPVPVVDLKKMLVEECKKQDRPYGLLFEDISGGFTFTERYMPQAFKVIPVMVYKVYPDGRPDELVRGVDIVGTPLTSFSKIIAAGDDPEVFNGMCGAESGRIRVSAISPSILVSQIEIEKKMKEHDKPPLLPPPLYDRQ